MPLIPRSVRFTGFIAPSDSDDTYAVHDEIYGRGGWRTVADLAARNAITLDRRREGMAVRVLDIDEAGTQGFYTLVGGTADEFWVEDVLGGEWSIWRVVADINARNDIPDDRRVIGMVVRVLDTGAGNEGFYTLRGGIADENWALDNLGGEWSGAYTTDYTSGVVSLVDEEVFTFVEADLFTTEGVGYLLVATPTTATGQITIEIFDDVAKLRLVGTHVIDLEAPTLRSTVSFGFYAETAGTLYCTLYCSGVPADQTATFTLAAVVTSPVGAPTPLPSPYGNGIEDDGTGKPRVALASDGGLAFATGKLVVTPDVTSPVYAIGTANGLSVSGAVDDSTSQAIEAKKVFDSVGCIPQGSIGYPFAGTYAAGAEIVDSVGIKWRCTVGGTPGTWLLVDNVVDSPQVAHSTAIAVGATYLFELPATGNSGVLLWLRAWAKLETGITDSEIPFRVRIYETSDELGREVVWQGMGIARQTALTAALPASQTYLVVTSNDLIEVDEGLVVYDDDIRYEFGRCSARVTGYINIAESLVDGNTWDAGSLVLPVTEWSMVPWLNLDGDPAKKQQVFVQVRHDGLLGDPNLVFYVQAKVYSLGVVPAAVLS